MVSIRLSFLNDIHKSVTHSCIDWKHEKYSVIENSDLFFVQIRYDHRKYKLCAFIENDNTLMVSIYIHVFNLHDDLWINIIFAYKTCIQKMMHLKRLTPSGRASGVK